MSLHCYYPALVPLHSFSFGLICLFFSENGKHGHYAEVYYFLNCPVLPARLTRNVSHESSVTFGLSGSQGYPGIAPCLRRVQPIQLWHIPVQQSFTLSSSDSLISHGVLWIVQINSVMETRWFLLYKETNMVYTYNRAWS